MDKIEVGEYVRLKDGIIAKLIAKSAGSLKNDDCYFFDNYVGTGYDGEYDFLYKNGLETEVIKHSKNITDLIEIEDIVELVNILSKEVIYIYDNEMLEAVKEDIKEGQFLQSILTHEEFESRKYNLWRKE